MTRKKNAETNGTATAEVPEAIPLEGTPAENGANGTPTNDKKKPLVSYRLSSDRTTSIELAVWSNTLKNRETNEEYEQLSITLARSYKDQNGAWCKGGSWRVHDVPCLMFLLQKGYAFALERRTGDTSIPF